MTMESFGPYYLYFNSQEKTEASMNIPLTKHQAEAIIAKAEGEAKRFKVLCSNLEQESWKGCRDTEQRAVEGIRNRFKKLYDGRLTALRRKRDMLINNVTALRIKHAATLCDLPIDAVMIEWVHDWEGWKPTGRTGKLELYLRGAEWPEANHNCPQPGAVIVRIIGKNGRYTKQATWPTRESRDTSFRKYQWLPKGQKPAKLA